MSRAVTITAMGVISPFGIGIESFWEGIIGARHCFAPIDLFDTSGHRTGTAALVPELPATVCHRLDPDTLSRADRLALAAAAECLDNAGLRDPESGLVRDPQSTAVMVGTAAGGILGLESFFRQRFRGEEIDSPRSLLSSFCLSALAANLAREFGIRGERRTIATVCSSSGLALAAAMDLIETDAGINRVLVVGAESLSEVTLAGFNSLRAIDPHICRPFDAARKGLVLGEGAGAMVVERPGQGGKDGVGKGALLGYGLTTDLHHFTAPEPGGLAIRAAITAALDDGGVTAGTIGYVNAHGTGTPHNDVAESRGILAALEETGAATWVSSTKSMIGHTLGAASILEAIATVLAMERGLLPPTANLSEPDGRCALRLVGTAPQPATCSHSLSNSFAFGGSNISIVLGRRPPAAPAFRQQESVLQKAVITGMGMVSPLGIGIPATLRTMADGSGEPCDLGCLGDDWQGILGGLVARDAVRGLVPPALRRRLNRQGLFLYTAMTEAMDHAGLPADPPPPMEISYGSAFGCSGNVHRFFTTLLQDGPRYASPYEFNFSVANAPPAMIAQQLGILGPIWVFAADELSFEAALETAVRHIGAGRAERVVVCAAEEISTSVLAIHQSIGLLNAPREPALVPGEGAVCMVLESVRVAASRSAAVFGRVSATRLVQDAESGPLSFSCDPGLLGRAALDAATGIDPQARVLVTDPCNHLPAAEALWQGAHSALEEGLRHPYATLATKPLSGESGLAGGIAMAAALGGPERFDTLLALNCGRGGTAAAIRVDRPS